MISSDTWSRLGMYHIIIEDPLSGNHKSPSRTAGKDASTGENRAVAHWLVHLLFQVQPWYHQVGLGKAPVWAAAIKLDGPAVHLRTEGSYKRVIYRFESEQQEKGLQEVREQEKSHLSN